MKRLIFCLLLSGFLISGYGQVDGKRVIKIAGIGTEQLIRGLLEAGYTIEKSQASMSIIITHLKQIPQSDFLAQIKASIKDGNVMLSGEYVESGKTQAPSPISDSGDEGSPCNKSWNLLFALARSFNKPMELL